MSARKLPKAFPLDTVESAVDYDYVLINKDLCESDRVLGSIVRAERVRRTRIEDQLRPILDTFQG